MLIVLFLIVWEPVPATRRILTILVFLAVIVGGAHALRRLSLEENPDTGIALADGPTPANEADTEVALPPKDSNA